MSSRLGRCALGLAWFFLLAGHDHGCGSSGAPTGATCDPRLRWDDFGRDFMTRYCTSCHSSELAGGERRGAPPGHDFDVHASVQAVAEHIDASAGVGPAAANDTMPPYGPAPTRFERELLASWLACGAP